MIPFEEAQSLGVSRLLNRDDLITVILRLQFDGWSIALRDDALHSGEDEPFINGRFFQGMVAARSALGLTNLFLVETPGIRVDRAARRPETAPDVIVLFAEFGSNEAHAIIECKRLDPLESPKNLRGEYVRSGIDRFVSGFYGANHDLDFMAAYVLRGTGADALRDVNDYLENVSRRADQLREDTRFSSIGYVGASDHVRITDARSIRLMHSYMQFSEI